jgi:hypothetical protein
MADLALDFDTWDCYIADGKIAEINTIDNPDEAGEVRQRAAIAIKTHRGELPFDTSRGLAWSEEILIRDPSLTQITSRARAYLLTVDGVTGVRKLEITRDSVDPRKLNWIVDLETTGGPTGPFPLTT